MTRFVCCLLCSVRWSIKQLVDSSPLIAWETYVRRAHAYRYPHFFSLSLFLQILHFKRICGRSSFGCCCSSSMPVKTTVRFVWFDCVCGVFTQSVCKSISALRYWIANRMCMCLRTHTHTISLCLSVSHRIRWLSFQTNRPAARLTLSNWLIRLALTSLDVRQWECEKHMYTVITVDEQQRSTTIKYNRNFQKKREEETVVAKGELFDQRAIWQIVWAFSVAQLNLNIRT